MDELLVHCTSRLGIKQFIPSKRARYGGKLQTVRKCHGVHICLPCVQRKKTLHPSDCQNYIGSIGKVVWDLAFPIYHKGYHLYVDNYYTSLPLFHNLYLKQTLEYVTVRGNMKGFLQRLVNTKLQRGEPLSLRNKEVLAMTWRNKTRHIVYGNIKPSCYYDVLVNKLKLGTKSNLNVIKSQSAYSACKCNQIIK